MFASALPWKSWEYLRKLTGLTPPVYAATDEVVARQDSAQTATSSVGAVAEARQGPFVISDGERHDADEAEIAAVVSTTDHDNHNDNDQDVAQAAPDVVMATAPPSPLPQPMEIRLDFTGSQQQPDGAAVAPAEPSDAGAADPPLQTPTIFQTIAAYGPAATDGAAAVFSLATARLSHAPLDEKVTGAFSGALWALAAVWQEQRNTPRNYVLSGANFLGGAAGLLSLAATFVLGDDTKKVAYASAAAWAANGFANLMRAGVRTEGCTEIDYWLAACGLANLSAAILSGVEAHVSANNQSKAAADLGTVSAVFWLIGAITSVAAVYAAGLGNRGMPPTPDLEAGGEAIELPTRNQAAMAG